MGHLFDVSLARIVGVEGCYGDILLTFRDFAWWHHSFLIRYLDLELESCKAVKLVKAL